MFSEVFFGVFSFSIISVMIMVMMVFENVLMCLVFVDLGVVCMVVFFVCWLWWVV